MQHKLTKQFLSLVLVFSLLLGTVPVTVLASSVDAAMDTESESPAGNMEGTVLVTELETSGDNTEAILPEEPETPGNSTEATLPEEIETPEYNTEATLPEEPEASEDSTETTLPEEPETSEDSTETTLPEEPETSENSTETTLPEEPETSENSTETTLPEEPETSENSTETTLPEEPETSEDSTDAVSVAEPVLFMVEYVIAVDGQNIPLADAFQVSLRSGEEYFTELPDLTEEGYRLDLDNILVYTQSEDGSEVQTKATSTKNENGKYTVGGIIDRTTRYVINYVCEDEMVPYQVNYYGYDTKGENQVLLYSFTGEGPKGKRMTLPIGVDDMMKTLLEILNNGGV